MLNFREKDTRIKICELSRKRSSTSLGTRIQIKQPLKD